MEHIVYVFEGFRLNAGRRQLSSSGGVVVPLNSRAMEALVLLVSSAGELVSKRQLLEGVWPSAVVEDNNINQCILAIRKALGETAGSNRFIMTVPGRGYRFVAPVTVQRLEGVDEDARVDAQVSVAAMSSQRTLVAAGALFAVLSGVALHAWLSPRVSAMPFDGNGIVVQLRHVVSPSSIEPGPLFDCLRQRPDLHLQVEVHLVSSVSSPPLWTGSFIAGADDLLPGDLRRGVAPDACARLPTQR